MIGIDKRPFDALRSAVLKALPTIFAIPLLDDRSAVVELDLHLDRHAQAAKALDDDLAAKLVRPLLDSRCSESAGSCGLKLVALEVSDRIRRHRGYGVVENVGTVAIRSQGPYSGTMYTTEENYNTKGFFENPGVFRVGADFEGNTAGRQYPFRWGFQNDRLLPGETQTVIGYIKITTAPSASSIHFWAGLEHEQVRIVDDKVNPVNISIGY